MKQPKRGWISPIRIKPSFHHMICFVIVTTFIVPTVPDVKAQSRYIASPACWFVDRKKVDDILAPDYVVEFEIPMGATNIWAYTTTAGIESRVLGFSTTYDHWATRNGKNVVRVVSRGIERENARRATIQPPEHVITLEASTSGHARSASDITDERFEEEKVPFVFLLTYNLNSQSPPINTRP